MSGWVPRRPGPPDDVAAAAQGQGQKMQMHEGDVTADLAESDGLAQFFTRSVSRNADKAAIDFLGRRTTYAELGRVVERAAAGLQAEGVVRGTRVAICLPNTLYAVATFFAVLRAGGIAVALNPLYVEKELTALLKDSGAEILVLPNLTAISRKGVGAARAAGVRRIVVCDFADGLPPLKRILFRMLRRREIDGALRGSPFVDFRKLVAAPGALGPVRVDPRQDVAIMQYTGGTTGVPKAAMLTHANVLANIRQTRIGLGSTLHGPQTVIGVLPLFHVFAMLCVMMLTLDIGGRMILLPRFEVRQLIATIRRTRATVMSGVPTIFGAIARFKALNPSHLRSLRLCNSGGAPLPAEIRAEFERLTGCRVREGYGLSETSPVVTMTPPGEERDGSCGQALIDTEISIRALEPPHRVMPQGERGEVWVRGPQVMKAYWNRPQDTRDVLVDGYFRTGDVGYLDRDGYLFLVDRIKDLILCGGYNVYPRVVEEALYTHPAVAEAVVIGVPDLHRGQTPKAFVSLRPEQAATPEELRRFLGDHVSKIELPSEIVIREVLPKTIIGKLSKKALLEEEEMVRSGVAATIPS